jgi:hypothetical protein
LPRPTTALVSNTTRPRRSTVTPTREILSTRNFSRAGLRDLIRFVRARTVGGSSS